MNVKNIFAYALFGLVCFSHIAVTETWASEKKITTAGTQYQEHSMWCWAATCRNAMKHYIDQPSQCTIANWRFKRNDCCGNTTFKWDHPCNVGGKIWVMEDIIQHWGLKTTLNTSSLSYSTAKSHIDNNNVFTMRFAWTSGGAHHILAVGWRELNGTTYIARMDPWPGEGSSWNTYSSTVSSSKHNWSDSLRVYGSAPNPDPTPTPTPTPTPNPSPNPNSCVGYCGKKAPGGCWCDNYCEQYGDCCADIKTVCDEPQPTPTPTPNPSPNPNSCVEYCGKKAPGGCWCDNYCEQYGDCCADKKSVCG